VYWREPEEPEKQATMPVLQESPGLSGMRLSREPSQLVDSNSEPLGLPKEIPVESRLMTGFLAR